MAQIIVLLSSLALYSLLCGVTVCMGFGIIALMRVHIPLRHALFLAPVLGFVFWTLTLGITGGILIPVRAVTPWLWGVSLVLFTVGVWHILTKMLARRGKHAQSRTHRAHPTGAIGRALARRSSYGPLAILFLCLALPIIVMPRYFWFGIGDYIGSLMTDGWSYIAIGQYMWQYPRGVEGGLAPLYQYGSIFFNSRYITFSLLGFLSQLIRPGDTQEVSALVQAWSLFCTASAIALFWSVGRRPTWIVALGTTLSIATAWMANLVWANNFDQGLSLVYMPAIAAVSLLLDVRRFQWWLVLGGLVAGALYTYPELVIAILGGSGLIALQRLWRERTEWRIWLGGLAITLVSALVLVSPFLLIGARYLAAQFAQGTATTDRPGEGIFWGLAERRFIPAAIWGLGGEFGMTASLTARNLLGVGLTLLAGIGIVVLIRRRQWGLVVAILLFIGATFYFILRQHYSYGAYKFLSLGWWMLIIALVSAIEWFAAVPRIAIRRGSMALAGVVALVFISQLDNWHEPANDFRHASSMYQNLFARDFRQAEDIRKTIGTQPLLMLVDEWFANEWAVFYLRDQPVQMGMYRVYMNQPFSLPSMRRAQAVDPESVRYVLTDSRFQAPNTGWAEVWHGGPYRLWHTNTTDWIMLSDITRQDGHPATEGDGRFLWLTNAVSNVRVFSGRQGEALLYGTFIPGPSLPTNGARRVSVTTNQGYAQTVDLTPGAQAIRVPVGIGETIISVKVLDTPTVATLPNGDLRALLLGVSDLAVAFDQGQMPQAVAPAAQAPSSFTLDVTFPARSANTFEPLVTTGLTEAGDFVAVRYLDDSRVAFSLVHWGANPVDGVPVTIEPGRTYRVTIQMIRAANIVSVTLGDTEVLRIATPLHPTTLEQVTIGENRIGGVGAPAARFSGTLHVMDER